MNVLPYASVESLYGHNPRRSLLRLTLHMYQLNFNEHLCFMDRLFTAPLKISHAVHTETEGENKRANTITSCCLFYYVARLHDY